MWVCLVFAKNFLEFSQKLQRALTLFGLPNKFILEELKNFSLQYSMEYLSRMHTFIVDLYF